MKMVFSTWFGIEIGNDISSMTQLITLSWSHVTACQD
jgi:hypothetical protein